MPKVRQSTLVQWIMIWQKLDYVINQGMACQWLTTDFLSVFACVFWVAPGGVALAMLLTFWFIQRVRVGPQDVHAQWQNVFLILNGLCLLYTEKWQNHSTHRCGLIHWHTHTHTQHWRPNPAEVVISGHIVQQFEQNKERDWERETLMERRIKGRWDKSGFTKNLERERCLQGQRLLKRLWSRFRSLWPVPLKHIQCVSH